MTRLMAAVLAVLRAYESQVRELDEGQRRVLRSIIASRIARDIVREELLLAELQAFEDEAA